MEPDLSTKRPRPASVDEPELEPAPRSPTLDEFVAQIRNKPSFTFAVPVAVTLKQRLLDFTQRPAERCKMCIFTYWKEQQTDYPLMSAVAAVALALPVTQVSVERAFSSLPHIVTARSNRLTDDTVEHMNNVKLNGLNK